MSSSNGNDRFATAVSKNTSRRHANKMNKKNKEANKEAMCMHETIPIDHHDDDARSEASQASTLSHVSDEEIKVNNKIAELDGLSKKLIRDMVEHVTNCAGSYDFDKPFWSPEKYPKSCPHVNMSPKQERLLVSMLDGFALQAMALYLMETKGKTEHQHVLARLMAMAIMKSRQFPIQHPVKMTLLPFFIGGNERDMGKYTPRQLLEMLSITPFCIHCGGRDHYKKHQNGSIECPTLLAHYQALSRSRYNEQEQEQAHRSRQVAYATRLIEAEQRREQHQPRNGGNIFDKQFQTPFELVKTFNDKRVGIMQARGISEWNENSPLTRAYLEACRMFIGKMVGQNRRAVEEAFEAFTKCYANLNERVGHDLSCPGYKIIEDARDEALERIKRKEAMDAVSFDDSIVPRAPVRSVPTTRDYATVATTLSNGETIPLGTRIVTKKTSPRMPQMYGVYKNNGPIVGGGASTHEDMLCPGYRANTSGTIPAGKCNWADEMDGEL